METLANELANSIFGSRCGLYKFDTPNATFKPLEEYIDSKGKIKKLPELLKYISNTLGDVIVLEEKRYYIHF